MKEIFVEVTYPCEVEYWLDADVVKSEIARLQKIHNGKVLTSHYLTTCYIKYVRYEREESNG